MKNLKEYILLMLVIQELLFVRMVSGFKCHMIINRIQLKKKIEYINQVDGLMKEELKEI